MEYLSVAMVIEIHAQVMSTSGKQPMPLRDEASLEAALYRPQMRAYYPRADLIDQAAYLAVGISQAQAFVDGNKRTAFAAMLTFLGINGYWLTASGLEIANWLIATAEAKTDRDQVIASFTDWLRSHVVPYSA